MRLYSKTKKEIVFLVRRHRKIVRNIHRFFHTSGNVLVQVGHDLTAGLPGHSGVVTVAAFGGDFSLSVLSGQSSSLATGLYIDLDGEAYEIESVGSLYDTITLVEVRII